MAFYLSKSRVQVNDFGGWALTHLGGSLKAGPQKVNSESSLYGAAAAPAALIGSYFLGSTPRSSLLCSLGSDHESVSPNWIEQGILYAVIYI